MKKNECIYTNGIPRIEIKLGHEKLEIVQKTNETQTNHIYLDLEGVEPSLQPL